MKNLLISLSVFFTVALSAQEQTPLKVMSYNLRFGELATLEKLASYIWEQEPDIVALQELDWKTNRGNAKHQNGKEFINELAFYTGMFGVFGKTISFSGGYYGIGILSKYPVVKTERFLLPNPENTEQRALLITEIELDNGQLISFASVHLALNEKERDIQMQAVNKKMKQSKGITIVAGDFNTNPDEDILVKSMKGWTDALPENEYTFATYKPEVKIDYIFYKPEQDLKLIRSYIGSSELSDHFPCFAEFEIESE